MTVSKEEMEERLRACDPFDGGMSKADAAIERLAPLDEARVSGVLGEVLAERRRQHERWGDQSALPDVPSRDSHVLAAFVADEMRTRNAKRPAFGSLLLEEAYEALAEHDPDKLRAELVQVAAVAVQWIEAIDKRGAR